MFKNLGFFLCFVFSISDAYEFGFVDFFGKNICFRYEMGTIEVLCNFGVIFEIWGFGIGIWKSHKKVANFQIPKVSHTKRTETKNFNLIKGFICKSY